MPNPKGERVIRVRPGESIKVVPTGRAGILRVDKAQPPESTAKPDKSGTKAPGVKVPGAKGVTPKVVGAGGLVTGGLTVKGLAVGRAAGAGSTVGKGIAGARQADLQGGDLSRILSKLSTERGALTEGELDAARKVLGL